MNMTIDRSKPPAPGPAPEVHPGLHSTFNLANGLRVIVVENHKLPLVSVQVRFDIPPVVQGERAGCADLFGDLLAAGTGARSKARIDEEVDALGALLHTTPDGLYATALRRKLPTLLDVMQDVLTAPAFSDGEFVKARTRMLSGIVQRGDDPDAIAESVGRRVIFGAAHPYGEMVTAGTLANLTSGHVRAHYRRFFRPDEGYLVFVGDLTEQEARVLAREHFGDWRPVPINVVRSADGTEEVDGLGTLSFLRRPRVPVGRRRIHLVHREAAQQSVVRVGFPLDLHPRDQRSMSAQVMNTILGGGVFNARLMQNLREDKGWTYGAYSHLDVDRGNSSLTAMVSVRTGTTARAVQEILREMERMREGMVTADELELARNHMAGSFGRSLEDPRTVARFALNTQINDLPRDHYDTYLQRLEAITAEDVRNAARDFLHPDAASVLVVGDRNALGVPLAALALDEELPVMELDSDGREVGPVAVQR